MFQGMTHYPASRLRQGHKRSLNSWTWGDQIDVLIDGIYIYMSKLHTALGDEQAGNSQDYLHRWGWACCHMTMLLSPDTLLTASGLLITMDYNTGPSISPMAQPMHLMYQVTANFPALCDPAPHQVGLQWHVDPVFAIKWTHVPLRQYLSGPARLDRFPMLGFLDVLDLAANHPAINFKVFESGNTSSNT
jgi:hypothetical protein